jgi:pantetheine-phosphate adenylyltransferase
MASVTAIFAGTFDPITLGHCDLIARGAKLFDQVVVSVSRGGRNTLLDAEARLELVEHEILGVAGVRAELFEGLVVDQAVRHGATVLLRGVRGARDLEYELQMAYANRGMRPALDTVFLPPSPALALISGTLVREVATLGGDVSAWVSPYVEQALKKVAK